MLACGHLLEVGKIGIVGFVAGSGKPRIALDVGADAVFFNNPYLPQTRSEMALPLIARGKITGVLDVQSIKPAAFSEDDLTTLQILADQVALAIDNTRLIVEMNQTLQELRNLYELRVGEAWQKSLGNRKITYIYNRHGVRGLENDESIHPILDEDHGALKVPIIFRGQPLGSVILRKDGEQPPWSHEEMQVVNTIVAQFSLALENARLLEETQRRAERERQIGEITAKIRSSNDPEVILRTAAAELRNALQVKHCQILLTPSRVVEDDNLVAGNGHHKPTNDTAYTQDYDTLQTEQSTQEKK